MTSRTIVEWHCNRCGAEESIEVDKNHDWCRIGGIMLRANERNRFNQRKLSPPAEAIGGDLCPECATSLVAWWHAPKQPAKVKEPV